VNHEAWDHFSFLDFCGIHLCSSRPAANGRSVDEQAIRQLNEDVLKAYNLGDVKTLDTVEDSDFVLSGDFGEVPKAQQLNDVRHRKENPTSVRVFVANARLRFYGDTALLTEVERYGEGDAFPRYETTSLWTRRGDSWKLVHMHFSKLSK
jgi:ketosteroid isomerase-like protein